MICLFKPSNTKEISLSVSIIKMTEMFMKLRHTVAKLKQDNIGSKHDKTWTNPALSRTNQVIYSKPDLIIHSSYFFFFFLLETHTQNFSEVLCGQRYSVCVATSET